MKRIITKTKISAPVLPKRKRVAAYARVSSGKDAMLQSLAAQISYYSELIQRRHDWEYAGVYADEATTGTKDTRMEFQRLLADCRNGKIDMVITKSISRFARNTVTLLETVRELKLIGVDVFFEEQNIHSCSGDGELMLSILASFAQEESRSVSENCKWRIRKQFEEGELWGLGIMYGYQIKKGKIKIHPEQASIVRMIFNDYIGSMGGSLIAKKLRELEIPTILGGTWSADSVTQIINNEKYTGNALLQKRYVKDHMSKLLVLNRGNLPKYYAEDTHPAIIDNETFDKAQAIMKERRKHFNTKDNSKSRYPFSGIIKCGNCGKNYKRRIARGKAFWQCSTYLKFGKADCHAKQIPESTLYSVAAEVLELDEFDTLVFTDKIFELQVPEPNILVFIFRDGHSANRVWKDRSRRESWTEEMREVAREREKRRQ